MADFNLPPFAGLLRPLPSDPGAIPNALRAQLAGLLGFPADAVQLSADLGQQIQGGLLGPQASQRTNIPFTSEAVAQGVGADLNRPSGLLGLIGAPDPSDVARLATAGLLFLPRKIKQAGKTFETGKPVEFNFVHNKESATELFGAPNAESPFGRGFEPSGRFVIDVDKPRTDLPENFVSGKLRFENPLVIDNAGLQWKQQLSETYGGRTGKDLSQALIDDGFDGVVTIDGEHTSEILDLTTFDKSKAKF